MLVIALLTLGPKRLRAVACSMGRGIREFKDSIAGRDGSGDVASPDASVADEAPTQP